MNFQFGHQQQIKDIEALIGTMNNDGAPIFGTRDEIRVLNKKCPAVPHMDGKGSERLGMMRVAKLLDSHTSIIAAIGGISPLFT